MKTRFLSNLLLKRLLVELSFLALAICGYMECKVIGVGPGRYNPYVDKTIPTGISVGDRVLINQGVIAKLPITKAGKKVKWSVVPASECIGPLEDDETI